MQRASPFSSSNFSEWLLMVKASMMIFKALLAASEVLCCKSSADWFVQSITFCQQETLSIRSKLYDSTYKGKRPKESNYSCK